MLQVLDPLPQQGAWQEAGAEVLRLLYALLSHGSTATAASKLAETLARILAVLPSTASDELQLHATHLLVPLPDDVVRQIVVLSDTADRAAVAAGDSSRSGSTLPDRMLTLIEHQAARTTNP